MRSRELIVAWVLALAVGAVGWASEAADATFHEQAVVVGSGEWTLPGTLTLPEGVGPFHAIVLIHGSGPSDQDETVGANKPFRDLAWGLAARGIAVLRYEKRTKVYAQKIAAQLATLTVDDETVDDAEAAILLLRRAPEIDAGHLFVLGHSFGGMMAPRIARRQPRLAGIVIMAGNTRSIGQMLVDQTNYMAALDGTVSDQERAQLTQIQRAAALVDDAPALQAWPADRPLLGAGPRYWRDLLDYHPERDAAGLPQPMLILHAQRDYQVTSADYRGWQAALSSKPTVTWKAYPTLNHLFIAGEGPSTPSEYERPGHVADEVLEDIATWIAAH